MLVSSSISKVDKGNSRIKKEDHDNVATSFPPLLPNKVGHSEEGFHTTKESCKRKRCNYQSNTIAQMKSQKEALGLGNNYSSQRSDDRDIMDSRDKNEIVSRTQPPQSESRGAKSEIDDHTIFCVTGSKEESQ
eukprot:10367913-Ditylum_brightwellii.AAC.1